MVSQQCKFEFKANVDRVQKERVFVKALEKAKLRQIRIHDLRHSYATLRISKGDNIAEVSNQLGHFSETFTIKNLLPLDAGQEKS